MSTTTEDGIILTKKADDLMKQAYSATRLVDSHNYFLCAADLYQEAGDEYSAIWAYAKADQVMRVVLSLHA